MSGVESTALTAVIQLESEIVETIAEQVAAILDQRLGIEPSWLGVEAAAHYLDWPKKRVYNLVAASEIPHRKQGNRLLFHRAELDAWLNGYYQGPSELAP